MAIIIPIISTEAINRKFIVKLVYRKKRYMSRESAKLLHLYGYDWHRQAGFFNQLLGGHYLRAESSPDPIGFSKEFQAFWI